MVAAYVIATVSGVEVLGPSVLAVFGSNSTSTWANIAIATALGLVMLIIAVIGIKITARTQVGIALVEYGIMIGFAAAGLASVLGHAAMLAVCCLAVIYTFSTVGLQGAVSPASCRPTPPRRWSTSRRRSVAAAGPR